MNPPTELPHKLLLILGVVGETFVCNTLQAGSATWSENPVSDDWYTAANWNPQTVPNGPNDVATLGASSIINVNLPDSSTTVLNSLVVQAEEPFFTVGVRDASVLTFVGAGAFSEFDAFRPLIAGVGGTIRFQGSSTAQIGIADLGSVLFQDNSSSTDNIDVFGETDAMPGGVLTFSDQSRAGGLVNALIGFVGKRGGVVYFNGDSTADELDLGVYGEGFADISGHHPPGLAVRSIYADGTIFLGANNLTVSNHPFFVSYFGGTLMDGGASGGTGGSFTKVGPQFLILIGSSSYTGGTTIAGGKLLISTDRGRTPVGSGDVHVNAGSFGGRGTVLGNIIVGTGTSVPASLVPGRKGNQFGSLFIKRALTFASDGILEVHIYASIARSGKVFAGGVTITNGAQVVLSDRHNIKIATGKVLTVIENTAATPIAGTFANLLDGGTITVGANTYQADYEGGDGNDLTLTVIN